MVFEVEDKLLESNKFKENPESSIIYVRNRKSVWYFGAIKLLGIKATYYHGGLSSKEKIKTCNCGWMKPQLL
jgi:ATP-dependent DNA helicase RecQ